MGRKKKTTNQWGPPISVSGRVEQRGRAAERATGEAGPREEGGEHWARSSRPMRGSDGEEKAGCALDQQAE